jgi:hypothetical protein
LNTKIGKMSEMMKAMAEHLLCNPEVIPSSEAMHVALFLANAAWNESLGLSGPREGYRHVYQKMAATKPDMWNEFRSNDVNAMIDELVRHKNEHYLDDERRILTCGIPNGNIRVEWLPAAKPGVDSRWEMHLYGLVRTGEKQKAITFLKETRGLTAIEAAKRVAEIAAELGIA